ncbi:MAG: carotenoid biosynthesis protein [Chthoniobacter sp.]|uniref:carotenoid biosynthesis protein n=1 Tax=Chthoniobacter sp. TaxID=2510640 RepID=UPI0032ADE80B
MSSRPAPLARGLEPFVAGLWILFVLVSLLSAAGWSFGIGEGSLERSISNQDLRAALVLLLAHADLAWITLAAANVYFSLVESLGLATARRWALLILGSVIALAWVSAATGFPLGPIRYGAPLGMKLGPVPLGLPLFWFSAIIGAREALLRFLPRLGHAALAGGVGVLALLTDLALEPLAAQWRGFWFWRGASPTLPPVFDPPFTASLAWGLLAVLVALALRERDVVASAQKRSWKPAVTLAIFWAVFLAAHLAHRLKH